MAKKPRKTTGHVESCPSEPAASEGCGGGEEQANCVPEVSADSGGGGLARWGDSPKQNALLVEQAIRMQWPVPERARSAAVAWAEATIEAAAGDEGPDARTVLGAVKVLQAADAHNLNLVRFLAERHDVEEGQGAAAPTVVELHVVGRPDDAGG